MLAPKMKEVDIARAEIRQVVESRPLPGAIVRNGKINRNKDRVVRDGIVVARTKWARCAASKTTSRKSPRASTAASGLAKFNDIKEGDILEAFVVEEYRD